MHKIFKMISINGEIMAAMEPLSRLLGIQKAIENKGDILFELDLFLKICEELKDTFRTKYKDYFRLMKLTIEKENIMLESSLTSLIIQDILSTEEYSIEGVAYYTHTHPDVIQEIIIGKNQNPSAILLRKIVELHRIVRKDLYLTLSKRIAEKYLSVA